MYKVLLADDEVLDLEGMRAFVPWNDLGLEVVGAVNNGFAACKVLEKEKIDILVTDVRMPNMSGIELAKKAIEKWGDIKVVFVSGYQDFNYLKQALSLNACDYVLKPMDDSELTAALQKIMRELDTQKKRIEAERAYKRMIPKGRLIQYGQVRKAEREDAGSLDIPLDSILQAMTNYELVRIHDELDKLFQLAGNLHSKLTIQNFAIFLLMKLDSHLHTMNEDLVEMRDLDILRQFETIDDIHRWLRRRIYEISEVLHRKRSKKNGKLIGNILDYLRERLNDNITLRDVANRFSFSPNYLGHLFKEETGKNFSEYLIEMRMERARELLMDGNLKIYEIADRVGYRYLPYFSRQFRETFGMTPLEYRRMH